MPDDPAKSSQMPLRRYARCDVQMPHANMRQLCIKATRETDQEKAIKRDMPVDLLKSAITPRSDVYMPLANTNMPLANMRPGRLIKSLGKGK